MATTRSSLCARVHLAHAARTERSDDFTRTEARAGPRAKLGLYGRKQSADGITSVDA
jgi:hypothetical protein